MADWLGPSGIAAITAAAAGIAGAGAAVLLSRRKTRRIMDALNTMLDRAINGSFSERSFDESLLSAVEAKMARFLALCALSAQSLSAEKNRSKS